MDRQQAKVCQCVDLMIFLTSWGGRGLGLRVKWEPQETTCIKHTSPGPQLPKASACLLVSKPFFWARFLGACANSQAGEKTVSGGRQLPRAGALSAVTVQQHWEPVTRHLPWLHLPPLNLKLWARGREACPPSEYEYNEV